mgnify:CR=1 FL=1
MFVGFLAFFGYLIFHQQSLEPKEKTGAELIEELGSLPPDGPPADDAFPFRVPCSSFRVHRSFERAQGEVCDDRKHRSRHCTGQDERRPDPQQPRSDVAHERG